jgi:ATP/maltotriose-dependent transcriptional regulator MalT
VPRPRLTGRLNAGLHRKLTLVSAPAGFGKTTLLSEWIAGCGRPVAWLSLDKMGRGYQMGGDRAAASQTFAEALAINQATESTTISLLATIILGESLFRLLLQLVQRRL